MSQKKIKPLITALAVLLITNACDKDDCVSCIAEDANGKIVAHEVECDQDEKYSQGFRDGFKESHEKNGNTVTCSIFHAD